MDDLKGVDLVKIEENLDLQANSLSDKDSNQNNSDQDDTNPNKKKPRGSRYRGVSRNGNQWQVIILKSTEINLFN